MFELDPETEKQLADLPANEWHGFVSRLRPPEESTDPKVKAALALREHRGADRRGAGQRIDHDNPAASSKQAAVDAIREACGYRVTTEDD
jgi:hypothetical protein